MKKTMMAVLLFVGMSFTIPSIVANKQAAQSKEIAYTTYLNMNMEYADHDKIQQSIFELLEKEYSQTPITFTISNEDVALPLSSPMKFQYEIGTVQKDERTAFNEKLAEKQFIVNVSLNDTQKPVIEASNVTIEKGSNFDVNDLGIKAYDPVDGTLAYNIEKNTVDTSVAGEYEVVVMAMDRNSNKTEKTIQVSVNEATSAYQGGYTPTTNYTPQAPLDRNNLVVRGWKIVANDPSVSDYVLRSYMNELQNLPSMYSTAYFHTVYIDNSLPSGYLGLSYSDGRMFITGSHYAATTILHEATHMYDFVRGFHNDPALINARNAEVGRLPAVYSGNINDDTYEWVANIVVYYYYNPGVLQANAPQSYNYVVNTILR